LLITILFGLGLLEFPKAVTSREERAGDSRLAQLVEANVIAVHAYQVLLAKTSGKGDQTCFSSNDLSDAQLRELSEHQAKLLKSDLTEVRGWIKEQRASSIQLKICNPFLLRDSLSQLWRP